MLIVFLVSCSCIFLLGCRCEGEKLESSGQGDGRSVLLNAPVLVGPGLYKRDFDFGRIDGKLRKEGNLDGFVVVQIKKQVVFGYNYEITYRNSTGMKIRYKVYVSFSKIQILNKTTQDPTQSTYPTTPTLTPLSPSPQPSPQPSLYLYQQPLKNIETKLHRQSSQKLSGHHRLPQVQIEQFEDRYIYTLVYENLEKGRIVFRVGYVFGVIQVMGRVEDIGEEKLEEILGSEGFRRGFEVFKKEYPEFANQTSVIYVTQTRKDPEITYNLALTTKTGTFLATINYNTSSQTPTIQSITPTSPPTPPQPTPTPPIPDLNSTKN